PGRLQQAVEPAPVARTDLGHTVAARTRTDPLGPKGWLDDAKRDLQHGPPDRRSLPSAHVDVRDLDRVVSVAEAVPGRDVGLHVAGGIGRAGAKAVPPGCGFLPLERPVLPVVRALWGLELGRIPAAFAGEADVDLRHRCGARPCLSAHGELARGDGRAGSGVG